MVASCRRACRLRAVHRDLRLPRCDRAGQPDRDRALGRLRGAHLRHAALADLPADGGRAVAVGDGVPALPDRGGFALRRRHPPTWKGSDHGLVCLAGGHARRDAGPDGLRRARRAGFLRDQHRLHLPVHGRVGRRRADGDQLRRRGLDLRADADAAVPDHGQPVLPLRARRERVPRNRHVHRQPACAPGLPDRAVGCSVRIAVRVEPRQYRDDGLDHGAGDAGAGTSRTWPSARCSAPAGWR